MAAKFSPGDKVKCLRSSGYPQLKEGESYTVVKYEDQYVDIHFTWPEYLQVQVDSARTVWCHAHRFERID